MKIKVFKFLLILIIFTIVFANIPSFAASSVETTFTGSTAKVAGAVTATQKIIGVILDAVRIIGMGIALIMLTYIGIKFMMASPSERANIKQYSINFVIGAVILIGGTGLLTIVKEFAVNI